MEVVALEPVPAMSFVARGPHGPIVSMLSTIVAMIQRLRLQKDSMRRAPQGENRGDRPLDKDKHDHVMNHIRAFSLDDANMDRLQLVRQTASVRNDWLHRGAELADLDLYQYVLHIERVRRPARETFLHQGEQLYSFDPHCCLSKAHYQQTPPRVSLPRCVGAVCSPQHEQQGQDNAMYTSNSYQLDVQAKMVVPIPCSACQAFP